MKEISFSQNWNKKLKLDYFTTIRIYTKEKFNYYLELFEKNDDVVILLKGGEFCIGKIKEIEVRMLRDIPNVLLMTDIGADLSACHKIIENLYGKKLEWDGQYTKMIILCIQKVREISGFGL